MSYYLVQTQDDEFWVVSEENLDIFLNIASGEAGGENDDDPYDELSEYGRCIGEMEGNASGVSYVSLEVFEKRR